ncbi:prolyl oligopeptidase [Panaeolus papilionaceus]|nr:prolyl oligopeptidase [Panaeolus papilionaceus]
MSTTQWIPNQYPNARRSDHLDIYKSATKGEVRVADPYQWLEEDTPETDKWTTAQEAFTRTYLDKNPDLKSLEDAFTNVNNYPKSSAPHLYDDNRWYWFYNSGLEAQSVLWRSKTSKIPDPTKDSDDTEIFFDTNALAKDGTAALSTYDFSDCGKYFAYAISVSGSDATTIYVRRTDSPFLKGINHESDPGRLSEEIKFVKFSSICWTPDSKGFFYQRYPNRKDVNDGISTGGDLDAQIYYHRIGTVQDDDILVHEDKEHREWMFNMDTTSDGKYLVLYTMKDSARENLLWIAPFDAENIGPNIPWKKVVSDYGAECDVITNQGPVFYIRTNKGAPQYKVVTIDITTESEPTEFIPQSDAFLSSMMCTNKGYFVLVYKRDVKDEIYLYSPEGKKLERLAEDFVGTALVSGRKKQSWFFVSMSGFTSPGTIARYSFDNPPEQRWSIYRQAKLNGLQPSEFEARQVWYKSKDGTKIPMFIVRHKSTPLDGTAPAVQYGYGGFSISIDPFFSPTLLTFIQKFSAILAVPNIRGGGEFGQEWHDAGKLSKKQNCFDDFIAASEYLVENKYAARGKIILNGGSNGGLLVAASTFQAPEGLIGCAIAEVGVHDLLKFHKFTIGKAWTSDYGNPDDPKDFDFIYPISPVHNIPKDKTLPPLILLTADHDDRVVPMHSFKLAAGLQHDLPHNPNPLLLRVDKKAGHGAGKSTQMKIKESADKWGFAVQSLGLKAKDTTQKL